MTEEEKITIGNYLEEQIHEEQERKREGCSSEEFFYAESKIQILDNLINSL
jgi:hypothetical protein